MFVLVKMLTCSNFGLPGLVTLELICNIIVPEFLHGDRTLLAALPDSPKMEVADVMEKISRS